MFTQQIFSLAFAIAAAAASPIKRQQCTKKVFDLTSTQTVLSDFEVTSGSQSSIAADATGLTLSVTQSAPNLVLNSVTTYGPPLSLGVTMRGTDAPGIIPCVVVWSGVSGHDEIDLELMGGVRDYFMAPIWPHGEQPAYDSEVGVDTDYAAPSWNYVYAPPNNFDSAQEHYYEMHWDGQSISWSIDNTHIVTYNKVTDANWLTEQTNIRLGLWSTGEGATWAGTVDWVSHPTSQALIKFLTASNC